MKNEFTSGSWELCYDGEIDGKNGTKICQLPWDSYKEFSENKEFQANARLIAKSPELLEHCQEFVNMLCYYGFESTTSKPHVYISNEFEGELMDLFGRIKHTIKKATGE